MEKEIVNRVAESGLMTIDMEEIVSSYDVSIIDLKDFLWQEAILREKEFRAQIKEMDIAEFKNHFVGLICSVDAIVPHWAYMILTNRLLEETTSVILGNKHDVYAEIVAHHFKNNTQDYIEKRVLIKGCSQLELGPAAYVEIQKHLRPVVKSLMYGEACSNVPIHKK